DAQVTAAFKDKPTLLYDNCATQIYLGASSIETAERISKSLGEWTQLVEGYNRNDSRSWNEGGSGPPQGQQLSQGSSLNFSQNGRALLRPEEVLTLNDCLIAFQRGMHPILARPIKWFADPEFNPAAARPARRLPLPWWLMLAVAAALFVWGLIGRGGA